MQMPSDLELTSLPIHDDVVSSIKKRVRETAVALRAYAERTSGPRVYAIGDSHSASFGGNGIVALHVGPVTAYRVGRPDELRRLIVGAAFGEWPPLRFHAGLARAVIRPGDVVLMVFGEIDVRVHFGPQWPGFGSPEELACFLAQRLAAETRALASRTGLFGAVASVVPPSDFLDPDPAFPTNGSIAERVEWTRLVNAELAAACRRFELPFIDTYADYADERGVLAARFSDGTVHIRRDAAATLRIALWREFPAFEAQSALE